jgi:hypothetical protein
MNAEPEAFFVPDGDRFVATTGTRGPWDPKAQHGGPPIALTAAVLEQRHRRDGMQVVRVTAEILKPIPIAPLTVATQLLRPGKSVELLAASTSTDSDEVLRVTMVRIRTTSLTFDRPIPGGRAPPGPDQTHAPDFFPTGQTVGYHTAMQFRFLHGNFMEIGPAAGWGRMRIPLIAGQPTLPLSRVLILADSGNGISGELDYRRWMFINPDLTVYLHRLPEGEWICMDAKTTLESHGVGLAESVLSDTRGPVGRGLQSLYVAARR